MWRFYKYISTLPVGLRRKLWRFKTFLTLSSFSHFLLYMIYFCLPEYILWREEKIQIFPWWISRHFRELPDAHLFIRSHPSYLLIFLSIYTFSCYFERSRLFLTDIQAIWVIILYCLDKSAPDLNAIWITRRIENGNSWNTGIRD